jgi:polyisoprenoid-binding protein YceI
MRSRAPSSLLFVTALWGASAVVGREPAAPVTGPAVSPAVVPSAAQGGESEVRALGPQKFILDGKASLFAVQVFKKGAAQALAHDHVVAATSMSGSIVVDPTNLTSAQVEVTVQTAGLVNDAPAMRKRYHLPLEVSEKDRATILANMRSESQLDVEKFPTMRFVSTSVVPGVGAALTLKGRLTIHGVTRDVALPVQVTATDHTVDGQGSTHIKMTDFGIEPYSAFLGAVSNKDEMILHVRFVATRL